MTIFLIWALAVITVTGVFSIRWWLLMREVAKPRVEDLDDEFEEGRKEADCHDDLDSVK